MATVFHDRSGGLCRNACLSLNRDMAVFIIMACAGDEFTIRVIGAQGQKLEHDVITTQINGEVERCLVQYVAGIDVRTTAEGFLGTDERPTIDGIKEGGCRVYVHAGMAVVPIVCIGSGKGRRRSRTAGIFASLSLFLCVHGILFSLGLIGRLCMGPVRYDRDGNSRKTNGKSETGQE